MNQSEAHLHWYTSTPAYLQDPLFDFSEGLVPRLYGSRCTVAAVTSAVVHIGVTSSVSQTLPHLVEWSEVQTKNVVHRQYSTLSA